MNEKRYLHGILRGILQSISVGNLLRLLKEVADEELKYSETEQDKNYWARKSVILERLIDHLEGGSR
jgi:hypothetical protein